MLELDPIDGEYNARELQTSSGVGKTFTLANLRFSTIVNRLYDLSISSGTNMKRNAISLCHDFSTSCYFTLSRRGAVSGLLSFGKDNSHPFTRLDVDDENYNKAFDSSKEMGQFTEDLESIICACVEGEGPYYECVPISRGQVHDYLVSTRYSYITYDGKRDNGVSVSESIEDTPDVHGYFAVYKKGCSDPLFLTQISIPSFLESRWINDPTRIFCSNKWLKFNYVFFSVANFRYGDRPSVPCVTGFEGVCYTAKGGYRIKLNVSKTVKNLSACFRRLVKAVNGFKDGGKRVAEKGFLLPDELNLHLIEEQTDTIGLRAVQEWGESLVLAVQQAFKDELSKRDDDDEGNYDLDSALDDFKSAYEDLSDLESAATVEAVPDNVSAYLKIENDLSGAMVVERTFDPVADLLDYEGSGIMETAANLFYLTMKGDSLGEGGLSNHTFSAMDVNTHSGFVTEWASRGSNDPERKGMLRAISGGDFVYAFNSAGKLCMPLRTTHRCSYLTRSGPTEPRGTVLDFCVQFAVFKEGEQAPRILRTLEQIVDELKKKHFSVVDLLMLVTAGAAECDGVTYELDLFQGIVTLPGFRKRVAFFKKIIRGNFSKLLLKQLVSVDDWEKEVRDSFQTGDDVSEVLGSVVVEPSDVELVRVDPWASSENHLRFQDPNIKNQADYTSWESIDYLALLARVQESL